MRTQRRGLLLGTRLAGPGRPSGSHPLPPVLRVPGGTRAPEGWPRCKPGGELRRERQYREWRALRWPGGQQKGER
jgi:hypothetical protein